MLLEVKNLHVKYGTVEALHGINLHVDEGEIVTILGANGAGKSTTLMTISGLMKPSEGEIWFDGKAIHTMPAHKVVEERSPSPRKEAGLLDLNRSGKSKFRCVYR